jgi:hypothetical protein
MVQLSNREIQGQTPHRRRHTHTHSHLNNPYYRSLWSTHVDLISTVRYSYPLFHRHSLNLSPTLTPNNSPTFLSLSITFSLTHFLIPSLPHLLTHYLPFLTHSLTPYLPFLSHSLTISPSSLSHSLSPLPQSLTHSPTRINIPEVSTLITSGLVMMSSCLLRGGLCITLGSTVSTPRLWR